MEQMKTAWKSSRHSQFQHQSEEGGEENDKLSTDLTDIIFKAALVFNAMNPVVVSGPVCVKKKFTSDNFIHGMKIFRIA